MVAINVTVFPLPQPPHLNSLRGGTMSSCSFVDTEKEGDAIIEPPDLGVPGRSWEMV